MMNSNLNAFLQGYGIREHKNSGILLAEKQIFFPQKEIILLDQNQDQDLMWDRMEGSILADDSASFLKGGRKL